MALGVCVGGTEAGRSPLPCQGAQEAGSCPVEDGGTGWAGRGGLHPQNGGEGPSGGPTKGSNVGPGVQVAGPEPTPESWGLKASP